MAPTANVPCLDEKRTSMSAEFGNEKEEEFLKKLEMDINEDLGAEFEEQQDFDEKWEWFDLYDKIHRRIK